MCKKNVQLDPPQVTK